MNKRLCFWRYWCLPVAQAQDNQSDPQFKQLVSGAKGKLKNGQLKAVAAQFRAAAALQPAPSLLLRVVSIYGDIAQRSSNQRAGQCTDVQLTLRQFFAACAECVDSEKRACRVQPSQDKIRYGAPSANSGARP